MELFEIARVQRGGIGRNHREQRLHKAAHRGHHLREFVVGLGIKSRVAPNLALRAGMIVHAPQVIAVEHRRESAVERQNFQMATTASAERSADAPEPGEAGVTGPSIHVVRARKLLFGGLVGGLAAAMASMVLFTILDGTRGSRLGRSGQCDGALLLRCRPAGDGGLRRRRRPHPAVRVDGQLHGSGRRPRPRAAGLQQAHRGLPALWPMASSSPPSRWSPAGSWSRSGSSTGCGSASTTPSTSRRRSRRTAVSGSSSGACSDPTVCGLLACPSP